MLVVVLVLGCLATPRFYRTAKEADLHPGKAAGIPLISALVAFATNHCIQIVLVALEKRLNVSAGVSWSISCFVSILIALAYFLFISRNWAAIARDAAEYEPPSD